MLAGGVESMSRAPFVIGKAEGAFSRSAEIFDTTIGWRFVNPAMRKAYGVDSMPETAEHVAEQFGMSRTDQDAFALRSQARAHAAQERGWFAGEIAAVEVPGGKAGPTVVDRDEHPRSETTLEQLARLKPIVREGGTVTAGNASGVNDGAAALIVASEGAARRHGLTPRARVVGYATAGVAPRIMGVGPVPAARRLMERTGLAIGDFDVVELNEAFAAQGLAVPAQPGACRRRRPRQSERRGHRARPSPGRLRGAARPDRGPPSRGVGRAPGARDALHRRGPGRGDGGRAGLRRPHAGLVRAAARRLEVHHPRTISSVGRS